MLPKEWIFKGFMLQLFFPLYFIKDAR